MRSCGFGFEIQPLAQRRPLHVTGEMQSGKLGERSGKQYYRVSIAETQIWRLERFFAKRHFCEQPVIVIRLVSISPTMARSLILAVVRFVVTNRVLNAPTFFRKTSEKERINFITEEPSHLRLLPQNTVADTNY